MPSEIAPTDFLGKHLYDVVDAPGDLCRDFCAAASTIQDHIPEIFVIQWLHFYDSAKAPQPGCNFRCVLEPAYSSFIPVVYLNNKRIEFVFILATAF